MKSSATIAVTLFASSVIVVLPRLSVVPSGTATRALAVRVIVLGPVAEDATTPIKRSTPERVAKRISPAM